jgi:hypothetical protein
LAIETGRYSKPKTPHNEKFCKFCKDQVEDESEHLFSVLLIVFGVLFEYEILNILVVQTFCIFYYRKEISPRILLL